MDPTLTEFKPIAAKEYAKVKSRVKNKRPKVWRKEVGSIDEIKSQGKL